MSDKLITWASERILCYDCECNLENVDTWEPFIRTCSVCYEQTHVRLCANCIAEISDVHMADNDCRMYNVCTWHDALASDHDALPTLTDEPMEELINA